MAPRIINRGARGEHQMNDIHHTDSPAIVNTPSCAISTREDIFRSTNHDLGIRGLEILGFIVHLCLENGGLSCKVSQMTIARHVKCCVTTVKDKLDKLASYGHIRKENILPKWHKDEQGKKVTDWSTNWYTLTPDGASYWNTWG